MTSSASGPVSQFIDRHYRHFNAAALKDAAEAYRLHMEASGRMLVSLAGAMSTAELGRSLAEMIRQGRVSIISCTGANLEEDLMNLVAHDHYERLPGYRDLTPQQEWQLLERGLNRMTDTCIPEEDAFRKLQHHSYELWHAAQRDLELFLPDFRLLNKLRLLQRRRTEREDHLGQAGNRHP